MDDTIRTTLGIALGLLLYSMVVARQLRSRKLPPGPKKLPIIGNMFDIPKDRPWVAYRDWGLQLNSDVIFIDLPRQPTLIINSLQAALDLMEKRSRKYADKPIAIMDELTGWDWNIGLMPYGPRWRDTRRAFHQYFNSNAARQYHDIGTREVHAFLKRATSFATGLDIVSVSQTFTAIIFEIVYGIHIYNKDDRYVFLSQKAVEGLSLSRIPGAFWVEYFPILKYVPSWVPGSSARKFGEKYKPLVLATRDEPYDAVKKAVDSGTALPSVAQKLIHKNANRPGDTAESDDYSDRIARDATGIAYAAAVDTQTMAAASFFLAMLTTPSAQRKAQAELDAVVGQRRLPTFDDIQSLPYIQAILMEVMRWAPVLPLGVPHCTLEDDEYKGYLIPKGTIVCGNVWGIFRDPKHYPDPDRFNPDRFLREGKIDRSVPKPDAFFGYGRRLCPGRHLATDHLSLFFASVLHVYNITPLPGSEDLHPEFATGLMSNPEHVPCALRPRNAAMLRLLEPE